MDRFVVFSHDFHEDQMMIDIVLARNPERAKAFVTKCRGSYATVTDAMLLADASDMIAEFKSESDKSITEYMSRLKRGDLN